MGDIESDDKRRRPAKAIDIKEACGAYDLRKDSSNWLGNFNFTATLSSLVTRYVRIMQACLAIELLWLLWPALAYSMYGGKSFFSIMAFAPVLLRIIFILACIFLETRPFRIAPTISTEDGLMTRGEAWIRYFGVYGRGHHHWKYMMFSKYFHSVIILLSVVVQVSTRHQFNTDNYWLINTTICFAYIWFTFELQWYALLYGVSYPRTDARKNKIIGSSSSNYYN